MAPLAPLLQWHEIQVWWREGAAAWEQRRRDEAEAWRLCKAEQRAAWRRAQQQQQQQQQQRQQQQQQRCGAAEQQAHGQVASHKRKQPDGGDDDAEAASCCLARTSSSPLRSEPGAEDRTASPIARQCAAEVRRQMVCVAPRPVMPLGCGVPQWPLAPRGLGPSWHVDT